MKTTELEQRLQQQRLGEMLQEAALVNSGQVQVALMEQSIYSDLRIGEILALHGWIAQKTADFFAEFLPLLLQSPIRKRIGNYFYQAGLLDESQIGEILEEQAQIGGKFGMIAVFKGFIKAETLSFFLQYFFPEHLDKIAYKYLNQEIKSSHDDFDVKKNRDTAIHSYEELTEEGLDDIPWID